MVSDTGKVKPALRAHLCNELRRLCEFWSGRLFDCMNISKSRWQNSASGSCCRTSCGRMNRNVDVLPVLTRPLMTKGLLVCLSFSLACLTHLVSSRRISPSSIMKGGLIVADSPKSRMDTFSSCPSVTPRKDLRITQFSTGEPALCFCFCLRISCSLSKKTQFW